MKLNELPDGLLKLIFLSAVEDADDLHTHLNASLVCKRLSQVVRHAWYPSIDLRLTSLTGNLFVRTLTENPGIREVIINMAIERQWLNENVLSEKDTTTAVLRILSWCPNLCNVVLGGFPIDGEILNSSALSFPSIQRLTLFDMLLTNAAFAAMGHFPNLELLIMGSIGLMDESLVSCRPTPSQVKALKLDLCFPLISAVSHSSHAFSTTFSNLRFLTIKSHDIADIGTIIYPVFAPNLVTLYITITERFFSTSTDKHQDNHLCPLLARRLTVSPIQHLKIDGSGAQVCSMIIPRSPHHLRHLEIGPVHSGEICDADPWTLRDELQNIGKKCDVLVEVMNHRVLLEKRGDSILQSASDEAIDEWKLNKQGQYGTTLFPDDSSTSSL